MLIPISDLTRIWRIKPDYVLHVGAHMAEEAIAYRASNWGHVTWVEAQPKLTEYLRNSLDAAHNSVINAAVWSRSGIEMELNIASNSQSTSLLEFGSHSISYPGIKFIDSIKVKTATLESKLPKDYFPEFVNLDIQGVELEALKGLGGGRITKVKWIYCEINSEEVYKGCALLPDLDDYLRTKGFLRVYTKWAPTDTWGDALYARNDLYKKHQVVLAQIRQNVRFLSVKFLKNFYRANKNLTKIYSFLTSKNRYES